MIKLIYPYAVPIALSLTAYNAFLTGFIVLLKRRDQIGVRYFISSLIISLWGIGLTFLLNNDLPPATSQSWGIFSQILALWIPVTWFHFVLVYTDNGSNHKILLRVLYGITLLIFPFTFTKYYVSGFRPMVGFQQYPIPGIAYIAFTILFAGAVLGSFGIFAVSIARERGEKRKDYQMLCYSSLYGFATGSLSLLAAFGVPLPQYNLLIMPFWQILLTYVMIRHRVFDVQEVADAFQREKITALGIMAASLNHEMRNPLYIAKGKIEGYLDAVETARNSNPQEVIHSVSAQLDRTLDIMQRFSDFARPQMMIKKEEVLFADVFRDVSELISYEIQKKKIKISVENQEGLRLRIHRRQLEEILVNLMINASQAIGSTDPGFKMQDPRTGNHELEQLKQGEIKVKAYQQKGGVTVEISDNGPGISEENQRRIFDPFFSTKSERGMGLGLYITKQLVEKNGGKISVRSKLGKGTTFMLEFKV